MEPVIDRRSRPQTALASSRSATPEGKSFYSVGFRSSVNHEGSTDGWPGAADRTSGNSFWHRTHQRRAMWVGA